MFRQNCRLFVVHQTGNSKYHFKRGFFDARCVDFFHRLESWQSEKSKNCCAFWLGSIIKRLILSLNKFDFLHPDLNQKSFSSSGGFNWKVLDFLSCNRVLVIQKLEKKAFNFWFLNLSLFKPMFPQNLRLHLFHQDRIQKLTSYKRFPNGKTVVCSSLNQSLGSPKVPKSAVFTDFARFSNVYFCSSRNSIFSIKISSKKETLKEELSSRKTLLVSNIRALVVQKLQKTPFSFYYSSNLKSCFPPNYRFYMVPQIGSLKHATRRERFDGRIVDLFSSTRALTVQKLQKVLSLLISVVIPTFASQTTWLIFSIQILIKN